MKIATWNAERLRHKKLLGEMLHSVDEVNADILVLTETDQRLHPKYRFCYETPRMAISQPGIYAPTENRISLYTSYPCVRQHSTYDENTAICVELETEKGNLIVYGTIIALLVENLHSYVDDFLSYVIHGLSTGHDINSLCQELFAKECDWVADFSNRKAVMTADVVTKMLSI